MDGTFEVAFDLGEDVLHHAEVVATRQGWVVRDLGSMNGTYLNGSAVTGRQQVLKENDELRFGRLILASSGPSRSSPA